MRWGLSGSLLLLGLTAFLFPMSANAANTATIQCDSTSVTLGDTVQCTVEVQIDDDKALSSVQMPDWSGFKVLNQNTSRQHMTQIINMKMISKKIESTTFLIQPLQAGRLKVGPAGIVEKNRTIDSNVVWIEVVDLAASPAQASSVGDKGLSAPLSAQENQNANVFIRLIPEKAEVYENEQFTVTLYIYIGQGTRLMPRWDPILRPTFEGFTSSPITLPQDSDGKSVVIGNRKYRVQALERFVLTPTTIGKVRITPYRAQLHLEQSALFADSIERRSAITEINVKRLPSENQPSNFNPACVGDISFTARVDRNSTEVGQPVSLTLALQGNVDVEKIPLPPIPNLDGVKVLPPTEKKESRQQGTRVIGYRSAEFLLIPNRSGSFTIPPLTLPVFDSSSGTYKTISTPSFTVTATGSGLPPPTSSGGSYSRNELLADQNSLKPLVSKISVETSRERFTQSTAFYLFLFIPLAAAGLLFSFDLFRWARRFFDASGTTRKRKELQQAKNRLEKLASAPSSDFHAEFKPWFVAMLENSFETTLSDRTHEQIAQKLVDLDADSTWTENVHQFLDRCDREKYASRDPGSAQRLLSDAALILKEGLR